MTGKYESTSIDLVILMPVYNDWDVASVLIEQIDSEFANYRVRPFILLVDDGSTIPFPDQLVRKALHGMSAVDVVHLRRNLGHQRAIAVGLTYVFENAPCDAVLVMDSDGEDRPEDVPRLIDEFCSAGGERIVFAQRTKRMETTLFKACYRCYQALHRVLTGMGMRIGNFSVIPFRHLSALVVSPELWNHYAAAVIKLRLPVKMFETTRGTRLSGKSKMNFVSLVVHGLSAISVFGEVVGTRIIVATCGLSSLLLGFLVAVLAVRLFTDLAVPGWATYSSGLLLVLLVLILTATSSFLLFILSNRNTASFLPIRDSSFYIRDVKRAYTANDE
jgi:glycosyltransferase involved in cell wall biosynthesis